MTPSLSAARFWAAMDLQKLRYTYKYMFYLRVIPFRNKGGGAMKVFFVCEGMEMPYFQCGVLENARSFFWYGLSNFGQFKLEVQVKICFNG